MRDVYQGVVVRVRGGKYEEMTSIRLETLDEFSVDAFDLLGAMLVEPQLDAAELEIVKREVTTLIQQESESARAVGTRLFREAIYHHEHDEEELLKLVSAIQQTSKPGFMANPGTFEHVLEPDNVRQMADALAWGLGLTEPEPSSPELGLRQ